MPRRERAAEPAMNPAQIVEAYEGGATLRWIEANARRDIKKVRAELLSAGVKIRPRGPAQSSQRAAARALLAQSVPPQEVAARTGLTVNNVHALVSYERSKKKVQT
jgi:hypothetical protein